jgi:hypothetical protein
MADSVTVEHGGVSITTNTASEADLRTEMEAPAEPPTPTEPPAAPSKGRDDKGRFTKTEAATPPAEVAEAPEPAADETEPAARRRPDRDDTLPRHNPIARLNQALAQKAEAERKAAQLEAELARVRQPGVTQPVTPPAAPTSAEPQFDQFANDPDPYTAYLQAWTRWDRAQAIAQAQAQWEVAQTEKARAQTFQGRLADGRTRLPDFDQALTQADTLGLQVSAVMQEAIVDSPHAADLVHYLATHPEECTQLAEETQQTPVAAATVMRRLLESHLAPRAAPAVNNGGSGSAARASVSTAKPPVMPVGHSPVVSDEPPGESASAAEHARYWNRRLKVPGTR